MGKRKRALPGQLGLLPGFEAQAAHFHETPYEGARRLLHWLDRNTDMLRNVGLFVEPCAGRGAIPRHVERYMSERDRVWQPDIHLIELRDESDALHVDDGQTRVESPCAIQRAIGSDRADGIAITNLPWYDNTVEVVEAFWDKYPNITLIGLLCTQFAKDGNRPDWYAEHMPEHILRHGGRMSMSADGAKYPWPVEWNVWRPGGERGAGRFEILTAKTCPVAQNGTIR
jgi:hypothetical protein